MGSHFTIVARHERSSLTRRERGPVVEAAGTLTRRFLLFAAVCEHTWLTATSMCGSPDQPNLATLDGGRVASVALRGPRKAVAHIVVGACARIAPADSARLRGWLRELCGRSAAFWVDRGMLPADSSRWLRSVTLLTPAERADVENA